MIYKYTCVKVSCSFISRRLKAAHRDFRWPWLNPGGVRWWMHLVLCRLAPGSQLPGRSWLASSQLELFGPNSSSWLLLLWIRWQHNALLWLAAEGFGVLRYRSVEGSDTWTHLNNNRDTNRYITHAVNKMLSSSAVTVNVNILLLLEILNYINLSSFLSNLL